MRGRVGQREQLPIDTDNDKKKKEVVVETAVLDCCCKLCCFLYRQRRVHGVRWRNGGD